MAKQRLKQAIERQVRELGVFTGELVPLPSQQTDDLNVAVRRLLNEVLKGHRDPVLIEILRKQINKALAGDRNAAELLMDRGYGKAVQNVSVQDNHPVIIEHTTINIDEIKKDINVLNEPGK